MKYKIILWIVICAVGFNLVAGKGGKLDDHLWATAIAIALGTSIGLLVYLRNEQKSSK